MPHSSIIIGNQSNTAMPPHAATIPDDLVSALTCRVPGEIVLEILFRLPVKNIVKCKCVAKTWRNLILNRSFALEHYVKYKPVHPDNLLLLSTWAPSLQQFNVISDDNYGNLTGEMMGHVFPTHKNFRMVGCANGLICLSTDYERDDPDYFLFNPAIRDFMPLPKLQKIQTREAERKLLTVGYGYDELSNDYKIAQIEYFDKSGQIFSQTHVYSLKTNSWREIESVSNGIVLERACTAHMKGLLHWTAVKNDELFIVVFDLEDEKFYRQSLPEIRTNVRKPFKHEIHQWAGHLAAMYYYRLNSGEVWCETWLMFDNGREFFWRKMHVQKKVDVNMRVLAIKRSGEILYYDRSIFRVALVDPFKRTRCNLDKIERDFVGKMDAVNYRPSLVMASGKPGVKRERRVVACCISCGETLFAFFVLGLSFYVYMNQPFFVQYNMMW